ncbi:MAG: hypothetical protein Q7U31_04690 [Anaerolineaceae bacterium]|nr:hypothetical protein [Anaerolineaceae bacterium]
MKQTIIPIKSDAHVFIKCNADLSVEFSAESTLVVIVDQGDSLRMREENGVYRIQSDTDCRLILPDAATVTVEKTGGDSQLRNLKSRVVIGKVGGDLKLDSINGASVESVGGDCHIYAAIGAVELVRIGGSLIADGGVSIFASGVGGDARIYNFSGKIEVNAGDEVIIQISQTNVPEIRVKAGSDIELYLPESANCQLDLKSGGESIEVHAAGQDVELESREFSVPLGNGGATVALTAGDSIQVTDREKIANDDNDSGWDEDHWKNFGFNIGQTVRLGLKIAGGSVDMALKQAEKATKEASREVERVFRELDGKHYRPGSHSNVVGFSMDDRQPASPNVKAGPSDEERMLVLKMLQEKKITVEEAEKLLNALDR